MSDADLLARLGKLDTCAVADALDKLQLTGVVLGIHPVGPPRRIVGRSVTVRLEPATPEVQARIAASGTKPRHLGTAAVEAAKPGDVIVVANSGGPRTSGWGGILSTGAKQKGVAGVIVDGGCRDVDEAWELDLPVYSSGVVPMTARGRVMETGWNEPVPFGDITVTPGDYVIADRSGVVFFTPAHAEEVVKTAEDIYAREAAMAAAVRAGQPISEVMGATYEQLLERR